MKQAKKGQGSAQATQSEIAALKRTIRNAEKTLKRHALEIACLRDELHSSETVLAAERLKSVNERQAREGGDRLQSNLESMRVRGVIDARGRRVRKDLPAEMRESAPDVV